MRLRVMLSRLAAVAVVASALAPAATASAPGLAVNPDAAPATVEAVADDAAGRVTVKPGDTPDAQEVADCALDGEAVTREADDARNVLLGDGVHTRSGRTPVDGHDAAGTPGCLARASAVDDPTPTVSIRCIDLHAYDAGVTFPELDQGDDASIGMRPLSALRPDVRTNALEATRQARDCLTDNAPTPPCTHREGRADCDVVTIDPPRVNASDVHDIATDGQAIANDPPQPTLPDVEAPAPKHDAPNVPETTSAEEEAWMTLLAAKVTNVRSVAIRSSEPEGEVPQPGSGLDDGHTNDAAPAANETTTTNHTVSDATPLAYHAPDDPGEPYAPRPLPPKPLQGEGTDAPVQPRENRRDPYVAHAASASTTPAAGATDEMSLTARVATGTALALLLFGPVALYHRLRGARVLKQRARARMLDAIRERPGLTTREAAAAADVTYTTADYHLKRLLEEGFVAAETHGGRIRYYVSGEGLTSERRTAHAVLQSDEVRGLYREVQQHPDGISKSALARRLGVARSTVDWHLRGLLEAGLVTRRRNGREVRIHAGGDAA